ncbi:MAG: signal peptide peptidase SppA [Spirochaetia bacterium]|jgi:protease-4|nr:signal peptide peptidase SppA [Spirochaetia bacterium]
MEKNRKILISILSLFIMCLVIAMFDISLQLKSDSGGGGDINVRPISMRSIKFGPGIGVVRVEGAIEMGANQLGIRNGAEAVIGRIDELMSNSGNIKAIVLRINSPGGTVAATQEIYQKLWQARKKNIPLVASMGDIAASGGYYIASACNVIYANYGTLTGSIGVIAYTPNMKKLFDNVGIRMDVIKSGRYKDIMSSWRDISDDERRLLQEMINSSYKRFLSDVSLGRNIPIAELEPYADGRIVNGDMAKSYKLIDEIGGFEESLAKAKELAGLSSDAPVYEETVNPFHQILLNLEGVFKGGILEKAASADFYRFEYRYVQ